MIKVKKPKYGDIKSFFILLVLLFSVFIFLTFVQAANVSTEFQCVDEKVVCIDGSTAFCTDPKYELTCFIERPTIDHPDGIPDCCITTKVEQDCNPSLLICSAGGDPDETNTISIVAGPEFPSVVEFPTTPPILEKGTNFAFKGSAPAFEIILPSDIDDNVISIKLTDSIGVTYIDIPFFVTDVVDKPERLLLGIDIPEGIATGVATLALNLSDGSSLPGEIQIIDFLSVKVPTTNDVDGPKKDISEPLVDGVSTKGKRKDFMIMLSGDHYVGRQIFLTNDQGVEQFFELPEDETFTELTVLPASLNAEVKKTKVKNEETVFMAKVKFPDTLPKKKFNIVIIATTPRGTVSTKAPVKFKKSEKKVTYDDIFCEKNKPRCPNGKKAKCKNIDLAPRCIQPFALPDCCKKTEFDIELECHPATLFCPAG